MMEYWTSANDARRTYTGDDGEQLLAFNDGRMGRLPDSERIHPYTHYSPTVVTTRRDEIKIIYYVQVQY